MNQLCMLVQISICWEEVEVTILYCLGSRNLHPRDKGWFSVSREVGGLALGPINKSKDNGIDAHSNFFFARFQK